MRASLGQPSSGCLAQCVFLLNPHPHPVRVPSTGLALALASAVALLALAFPSSLTAHHIPHLCGSTVQFNSITTSPPSVLLLG